MHHGPIATEEYLGGFQVLTVTNKGAVNIPVQFFVGSKVSAHLGRYQGALMLDLCSVLLVLLLPLFLDLGAVS